MTEDDPQAVVKRALPELSRLVDMYVLLHRAQVMRRENEKACGPLPRQP